MDKIILDGREVKVGDRVYCLIFGWAYIESISLCDINRKPIGVRFGNTSLKGIVYYYEDGKFTEYSNRTLFWDEPKFEIPPPPKEKIKKWKWVIQNKITGDYCVSDRFYYAKENAEWSLEFHNVLFKIHESEIEE